MEGCCCLVGALVAVVGRALVLEVSPGTGITWLQPSVRCLTRGAVSLAVQDAVGAPGQCPVTGLTRGARGAGVLGLVVTHGTRATRVQSIMRPRAWSALGLTLTLVCGPGLHCSERACGTHETRVLRSNLIEDGNTIVRDITHLGLLGLIASSGAGNAFLADNVKKCPDWAIDCNLCMLTSFQFV